MAFTGVAAQPNDRPRQIGTYAGAWTTAEPAAKPAQRAAFYSGQRRSRDLSGEIDHGLAACAPAPAKGRDSSLFETLTTNSAAAHRRVAELELELAAAREELGLRDNENRSLQISLDLVLSENSRMSGRVAEADRRVTAMASELDSARGDLAFRVSQDRSLVSSRDAAASENARLFRRLAETDAEVERAHSQLERMKLALAATEADRAKLVAAVGDANKTRQRKTGALNTLVAVMSSRAVATRTLLTEVHHTLLAHTEAKQAAERLIADASVAHDAADTQINLLHKSLHAKGQQIEELEQSRSKLIEGTSALLKTLELRDAALADATEKIALLSDQIARLEAAQSALADQKDAEPADPEPKCSLDDHPALSHSYPERYPGSADALLANTIAF